MKKYLSSFIMLAVFETVAVVLWLTKDNLFYLFNFSYIGLSIALGLFLYVRKVRYARRVVQFLVGSYMLLYLGLICNENMQLEGFWYYLFTGVFEAATIHYAVAKIFGPLLFGRGWCGYACWTAMILDLLPYKRPKGPRKKLEFLRYIMFALSLAFVSALFLLQVGHLERIMFWSFLVGNVLYYIVGIGPVSYTHLQRRLEERAFRLGDGKVPVQLFGDFKENRESREFGEVLPDTKGRNCLSNLRGILPEPLNKAFIEGIVQCGKKLPGFDRFDAVLSGVESRTSSPLRIERNEGLEASVSGVYPCGEGAGYAGGITSAAMDGLKVAETIIERYRPKP